MSELDTSFWESDELEAGREVLEACWEWLKANGAEDVSHLMYEAMWFCQSCGKKGDIAEDQDELCGQCHYEKQLDDAAEMAEDDARESARSM